MPVSVNIVCSGMRRRACPCGCEILTGWLAATFGLALMIQFGYFLSSLELFWFE